MTEFVKHITIKAPKDDVWEVMANLGEIYRFNPSVINSYYTTDKKRGVGAGRICELRPAGKVEEIATEWDEGKGFLLEVVPIEKIPPIKNIYARLQLETVNMTSTDVSIGMTYETKLGVMGKLLNAFIIKGQMELAIEQLLQGLKINIEKGHEIKDHSILKKFLQAA